MDDRRRVINGNTVLDLGANIGYYAIMEAKVGSSGKIYAIEPDPRNIEILIKNLKLNKINDIFEFEHQPYLTKIKKQNLIYLPRLT